MSQQLLLRAPAPAITPETAGWRWLSYRSIPVDGEVDGKTGRDEVCLVNLGGRLTVTAGGAAHSLGSRDSPFAALPDSLYLPPGTPYRLEGSGLVGVCAARAEDSHPIQPIPADTVRVVDG